MFIVVVVGTCLQTFNEHHMISLACILKWFI